jgi:hypothetical protein
MIIPYHTTVSDVTSGVIVSSYSLDSMYLRHGLLCESEWRGPCKVTAVWVKGGSRPGIALMLSSAIIVKASLKRYAGLLERVVLPVVVGAVVLLCVRHPQQYSI